MFAVAGLAALGFAALTRAVANGKTAKLDLLVKARVHGIRGGGLELAAQSTTPFGKWWAHVPAALLTARRLRASGRTAAALTIAGTSIAAATLPKVLDRAVKHRAPPWERHEPKKQSYPSGHALQTAALALSTTYVLRREGLEAGRWSAALGPVSFATGIGRLLLDRHWASDVLGGYLAGIALGATAAGLYEAVGASR